MNKTTLDPATSASLLAAAREALQHSYSPYSQYQVGAALLTADGKIYSGCNVENASYGGTICAERTALVKAISEGQRVFTAIAVVCAKSPNTWPCGICRQFICEFGNEIEIIVENEAGNSTSKPIGELLPEMFGPKALLG